MLPTLSWSTGMRETLPKDLGASFVVFLVALPLCLGIAIASGAPPAAGLVTGIIGGLIVGLLAGSPLQVSGPAAGLTVVVLELIREHGLGMLGPIVLAAGLLQLIAGALRAGRWFSAISPAVIQGMLAGIGALIIAGQIHVMVDDAPRGSGVANILAFPQALWKGVVPLDGSHHHIAAAVGLVTILAIVAWSHAPKRLQILPPALVGVTLATVIVAVLDLPIRTVDLPGGLADAFRLPTWADMARVLDWNILITVVGVAVVASAETLVSAGAVDRMHDGPRHDPERELMAQGVGNVLCGLFGALPMTGVIVRSSANIQAGAQTRLSTMFHGAWILLFVVALPALLERVPLTALAALLVYTGFKLLSPAAIRELSRYGRSEVAIYLATMTAVVGLNLLEGIMVGLGLALVRQLWVLSRLETDLKIAPDGATAYLRLHGAATFLAVPELRVALARVPDGAVVTVDLDGLRHVDHACLELLADWEKAHAPSGGKVVIDWHALQSINDRSRPGSTGELASAERLR